MSTRDTRSEYTANDALHANVRRVEPRAVEHHVPVSNGVLWVVLVILGGAGALGQTVPPAFYA